MAYTKISLSLDQSDLAFLDGETIDGRFASRSAAVQAAIRLLRESRLADAYADAFAEWDEGDDGAEWDAAARDGIA